MPIVVVFDFPGEDIAKYHKVFQLGGAAVNAQPTIHPLEGTMGRDGKHIVY